MQVSLLRDQALDRVDAERLDQLVLEVAVADEEAEGLHGLAVEVGAESGPLEPAGPAPLVIHVAETEQLEAEAVGAQTPQLRLEPASAAQRHHRDSLRVEVASGAARHRPHRGGVGDAFDQDRLLHDSYFIHSRA